MSATYPFRIATAKTALNPARQYAIVAELRELEAYTNLFEDYGYGGDGLSWREHIETIIEEYQPGLLDHLEFAEQNDAFLAYADSPTTVRQFMDWVLPYFGDLSKLRKYFNQADPSDFFA